MTPRKFPPKTFNELMKDAAKRAGVQFTHGWAGVGAKTYRLVGRKKPIRLRDLVRHIDATLIAQGKRPSKLLPPAP